MIYLDQGWSPEDREWYYHFSQGSAFLSYDIYLNLEVADSQEPLRSGARYDDSSALLALVDKRQPSKERAPQLQRDR